MENIEKRILLIDDDATLTDLIGRYLQAHGWAVSSTTNPSQGLALLKEQSPSLLIIDMMMPFISGIELCREIRKESEVPIIFLTARESVADRIEGLKSGADDYIPKPVDSAELLARIEAILRRTANAEKKKEKGQEVFHFKDLEVNCTARSVLLQGEPIPLTSTEFEALTLLVRNRGKILTRNDFANHMRGHDWEVSDRSIDILMSRLRQKLRDSAKNPKYLKTIWGEGYLFVPIMEDG